MIPVGFRYAYIPPGRSSQMNRPSKRIALVLAAIGTLLLAVGSVSARPDKVAKAFKGKILFSTEALPAPDPENPKETIKTYREQKIKVVQHEEIDGVATWRFHFMAFMKRKPLSTTLSLDFYTDDKEKLFVAQKRMSGADPSLTLLTSSVSINADEGLKKGGRYIVKLTAPSGKKEVVLAEAKLTTK
jgi:hypothetical protein